MIILDHYLAEAPNGVRLTRRDGRAAVGAFRPEIVVVHYAVTDSIGATFGAMRAQNYFAHVTIDCHSSDGVPHVEQHLPFNARGAHAGTSEYKGRAAVNGFGVGIEIANPGPLVERDGKLFTVYGTEWHGPVFEGRHANPRVAYTHWAAYEDGEVDLVIHVCELLRQVYGVKDVVGHEDVAPGRKIDPGPAFPTAAVRSAVFGCSTG